LINPIQVRLAEAFVLRHRAYPLDLSLDITGKERTVSTHASLYINTVVGMADSAHALCDWLSLLAEALGLLARGCRCLCDLLEACSGLWGATRTAFLRRVARVLELPLHLLKRLLSLGGSLPGCPLFRGHGA
jgi:hypothetical protein